MSVRPEVLPGAPPPERGGGASGRRRLYVLVPVVVVAVAVVVVAVALWGLSRVGRAIALSAPGELPWTAGQRHRVTDPEAPDMYHSALLVGTLSTPPPGQDPACLWVTAPGGGPTYAVWPHGVPPVRPRRGAARRRHGGRQGRHSGVADRRPPGRQRGARPGRQLPGGESVGRRALTGGAPSTAGRPR